MQRADSLKKTLMLGKIEGRRIRGQQRMREVRKEGRRDRGEKRRRGKRTGKRAQHTLRCSPPKYQLTSASRR